MPGQSSDQNAAIFAKLAQRASQLDAQRPKGVPVAYNQDLPGGINNGIAQLREIKIGEHKDGDNKGMPFFYAHGTVVLPVFAVDENGQQVKVQGKLTKIQIPLYDTPKRKKTTLKEHYDDMLQEIGRLLRAESLDNINMKTLPAILLGLLKTKPYFKFRTSRGEPSEQYPNPMTFHNWEGKCDPPDMSAAQSGTVDNSANGQKTGVTGATPKTATGEDYEPADDADPPDAGVATEEVDLDALLIEARDNNDTDSKNALIEMAVNAGWDRDAAVNAPSWEDVVEMINNPQEGATDETPAEEPAEEPLHTVGKVCSYKPMVKTPAGKMVKAKKAVEVKVATVNDKNQTCTLTRLDNNTKISAVKWADLEPAV